MTAQALADFVNVSKYANHIPELMRRETAEEAGQRMFDMHRRRYPEAARYIDDAQAMFDAGKILGSQRALQFGGKAMEKKNARGFNCTASFCDRPRFFQEAFWLLLCGCGTGFSVQRHHVARLPPIARPKGNGASLTHVVADTIEGWADAVGELIGGYMVPGASRVVFDYDLVRAEGSPLSSGGKAPGPAPLAKALELMRKLLESRCDAGFLRPIDCYDLVMHESDAVLSGGIRRSSAIVIFSVDDEEMMRAKMGNWHKENPQRARSNNSALLLRGQVSRQQFDFLITCSRQGGDPGMFWSDSTEFCPNPCAEISFNPVHLGQTGWQSCNLSTINVEACRTPMDFMQAARAAAILGTLQAGYTEFPYLGPVSEALAREEALLGVSMTGIMRNPAIALDPNTLRLGAREVLAVNAELADIIGIKTAARSTCCKPEGTGSLKLQTSSGMTPDHSARYIRHTQVNRNEPPVQFLKTINPQAVEANTWDANGAGEMVLFCIHAPPGAVLKKDVTALDMLENIKLVKENWVDVGKRKERCLHPSLSHNVSNTVHVQDDEWGRVADFIFEYQHTFAGVTLLTAGADLDYRQAPFVEVRDEDEILEAYELAADHAYPIINAALRLYADLWTACDDIADGDGDWAERMRQLARERFAGDVRRVAHYLKDVWYLGRWKELMSSWRPVDYTQMVEETNGVYFEGEASCAGGACEIFI